MKHIICFSGGHSSALVALEVANRFGTENMILLNHDINKRVEHEDIKRFKNEVANYLNLPVTYANHPEVETKDQFDICVDNKAFAVRSAGGSDPICSNRLKTKPFYEWLKANIPNKNCVIYYGFDASEKNRVERRQRILGKDGYQTDYPLALWYEEDIYLYNEAPGIDLFEVELKAKYFGKRIYQSTEQIGIKPPLTYTEFKHANCTACLKAGQQHWYIVYCNYPELWNKAKETEKTIGHSILKEGYLKDLESKFADMKKLGIPATEKIDRFTFWHEVKKKLKHLNTFNPDDTELFGCGVECVA